MRKNLWLGASVAMLATLLVGCATVLFLAAGGSLSSSLASVAVLGFPKGGSERLSSLLPQGPGPVTLALHPDGGSLYVANRGTRSLAAIDTETLSVTADIPLEQPVPSPLGTFTYEPVSLAFRADGSELYVTVQGSDRVLIVDTAVGAVTAEIRTERQPPAVLVPSHDDGRFYLANGGAFYGHTVMVLDAMSRTVAKTLQVGRMPLGIAASEDGRWVVVANTGDLVGDPDNGDPPSPGDTVTLIDAVREEVVATLQVGSGPNQVLIDDGRHKAYVVCAADRSLTVVDLTSAAVATSLAVGSDLGGAAFAAHRDDRLYLALTTEQAVLVIDTATDREVGRIDLPGSPTALAVDRGTLFAVLPEASEVAAVDTRDGTLKGRVPVGDEPTALILDRDRKQGFALAQASQDLTAFGADDLGVRGTVVLGHSPFALAVTPDGSRLFVASATHNTLSAIGLPGHQVEDTWRIGPAPIALAVDATTNRVFVAHRDPSQVTRLDPAAAQVANFEDLGGLSPLDLKLSADGSSLYVATLSPLGVSVLDATEGTLTGRLDIAGAASTRPSSVRLAPGCGDGQFYAVATYALTDAELYRLDFATATVTRLTSFADLDPVDILAPKGCPGGLIYLSGREDTSQPAIKQPVVRALDLSDGHIVRQWHAGAGDFLTASPDTGVVFVGDAGGGGSQSPAVLVALITNSDTPLWLRAAEHLPGPLAHHPGSRYLYVANPEDQTVSVLDADNGQGLRTIPLPPSL